MPAVPRRSRWALDPENSSVSFVCKHVRSNVRGLFPLPAGTVLLDEDDPAATHIEATLDPSLVTTGVAERDSHLTSADFFDVARFPTVTFVSTAVARASATAYTATGDLTIRGITRSVTLAITAPPPFEHAGGIRRGVEATTTVDRKDFGLAWEFPGEGPGVVVGDAIRVTIDAELVLQPD
ncbi:MAG: YceI family protein [Kofleriaceae bacterium]